MKRIISLVFIISMSLMSNSCEKLFIKPDPKNTATSCFESLWTRIDQKYAFLDYKKINWDSVKTVYQPKVYDGMNDILLFKVLDSMLYTLEDGHVNLYSPFNISRNWEWYLGYPQNFDYSLLERKYLQGSQYYTGPFINQLFSYNSKRIGYVYYNSFSSNFSEYHLDFIMERFKTTDGLILDVRDNGGGITNNVYLILNRFVKEKILVGVNYEKTGNGHSDFGMSYDIYAEPSLNKEGEKLKQYLDKPIIILTNRTCYSACNSFVGFMSVLPNVTIIGDQTGGGGGLPTSFQLPNGWTYRYSSTYTALPNGFNIENGIPVDIHQDIDSTNIAQGVDAILDKAIKQF